VIGEMELAGVGAAPGIAVGPVWRYRTGAASGRAVPDVHAAAELAASELMALAGRVRAAGRTDDAEIFEAQALMALDPMLLDAADARVRAASTTAPEALAEHVESAAGSIANELAALPDETLAARAVDVRDVGARIGRIITGRTIDPPSRPSIAIADDLPPSIAADLSDDLLLGIALERGSTTSHAAILARGLGIPAVVGARGLLEAAATAGSEDDEAVIAAIDGETGRVVFNPSAGQRQELETLVAQRRAAGAVARSLRGRPGETADGRRIPLLANIGRPEDADRALAAGAEGVGLFRTEFLFVGRSSAPTEDEQVEAYRRVLDAFGDRPVVVRLLDVGGDKPLPYLRLAPEPNPFLGVRGFRLVVQHRELLLTQLRALARAGAGAARAPRVMAPMVATVEDVELAGDLVAEALAALDRAGVERAASLEVGIMIEVPSATLLAPELARRVDFFSIGSNDLTQYVLAMDRTHPELAAAADALHPAVLRAIRATVEGAESAGIETAVCGELAGDPAGALVLAGLGIGELSMDAGSLDAVRFALRGAASAELEALARGALAAGTAAEVRSLALATLVAARARAGSALGAADAEVSGAGRPA
jgi:phosphoenolpyruvate-protein phosphotransferase